MGIGEASTATTRRVHARDPAHATGALVILTGHAVLIYFMAQHNSVPEVIAQVNLVAVPIRIIQIIEPMPVQMVPRRSYRETPAVASVTPSNDFDAGDEAQESAATNTIAVQPIAEAQAPKDWIGAAAEADQRIAQSRRKGFGDAPQDNPASEKKPLGVFERGPPHRAGDIELFEDGVERRWVNSRCYRDFGGPPDPLARRNPGLNLLHCALGPRTVDGDLFDHLKPDYLKPDYLKPDYLKQKN